MNSVSGHIIGNMDDMESGLDSHVATVRTFWSVKAYSGEPLASVVTQKTSTIATLSTREMEKMSYPGPLPSVDYCTVYEVEDPNISTVEQNTEVDSVDETPRSLVVYCMRIYDCMIYKHNLPLIKNCILLFVELK